MPGINPEADKHFFFNYSPISEEPEIRRHHNHIAVHLPKDKLKSVPIHERIKAYETAIQQRASGNFKSLVTLFLEANTWRNALYVLQRRITNRKKNHVKEIFSVIIYVWIEVALTLLDKITEDFQTLLKAKKVSPEMNLKSTDILILSGFVSLYTYISHLWLSRTMYLISI